jgi:HSP20 family molecular chaperone IbpA
VNKVEINLTGNTLRIVAPVEGKEGRYEQNIQLDGVAANAPTQVSRSPKDNLIVVNVPKAAVDTVAATPSVTPAAPLDAWVAWDRDVLAQMDRMQREMDAVVNQAFVDFPTPPRLGGFFNQARFDSSFSVQEQGSNYIVRAYLPARDMGNVNVTVEGQILKIEAKGENTQQGPNGNTALSQKAQYSQVLTLPGPVQSDKMTVDRKENMLIVTLPKAAGPASPSLTQKTVLSAPGQRA